MNKIQGNQLNVFQIRSPTEGGSGGVATPQGGGAGATPPLTGFDLPGQVAGVQGAAPPAGCGAAPRPKRYDLVKTK